MNIWVFRVTRGVPGGNPVGSCPIGLDYEYLQSTLDNITPTPLRYDGSEVAYVIGELFNNNRLRQGWGVPGLDLGQDTMEWISKYIISSFRYWDRRVDCNEGMGRKNILNHMLEMNVGDKIFIPNVSPGSVNNRYFTLATVRHAYRFEDRAVKPDTWEKDFGHIIGVTDIKTYSYSTGDIRRSIFGAPFLHAIDPIMNFYVSYPLLYSFAANA